jgi:hypothetical protein
VRQDHDDAVTEFAAVILLSEIIGLLAMMRPSEPDCDAKAGKGPAREVQQRLAKRHGLR